MPSQPPNDFYGRTVTSCTFGAHYDSKAYNLATQIRRDDEVGISRRFDPSLSRVQIVT
jgi:hypothetical protein